MDNAVPSINPRAAVVAGLVAGAVSLLLEMLLVPLFLDGSLMTPPRILAATVMGPEVLQPGAASDVVVLLVAVLIQLSLSVAVAFGFAFLPLGRSVGMSVVVGVVLGMILYSISYAASGVFPWFVAAQHGVALFAHIVFGAILGWLYVTIDRRT